MKRKRRNEKGKEKQKNKRRRQRRNRQRERIGPSIHDWLSTTWATVRHERTFLKLKKQQGNSPSPKTPPPTPQPGNLRLELASFTHNQQLPYTARSCFISERLLEFSSIFVIERRRKSQSLSSLLRGKWPAEERRPVALFRPVSVPSRPTARDEV